MKSEIKKATVEVAKKLHAPHLMCGEALQYSQAILNLSNALYKLHELELVEAAQDDADN